MVAFPDALDARTLRAAARLASTGIVRPVLVGPAGQIRALASAEAVGLEGVAIEDPLDSGHRPAVEREFASTGGLKSSRPGARQAGPDDPLIFAGMLVRMGLVHGCVAGSVSPTAAVIRAAIRTIGLRPEVTKVSSYFLMIFPGRVLSFTDCAVVPDPTEIELAEIAGLAADNHRLVTGAAPVVAVFSLVMELPSCILRTSCSDRRKRRTASRWWRRARGSRAPSPARQRGPGSMARWNAVWVPHHRSAAAGITNRINSYSVERIPDHDLAASTTIGLQDAADPL